MSIAISGVTSHPARLWLAANETSTAAITAAPASSLTQPTPYFRPTTGQLRNLPNGVIGSGGRGFCVYPVGVGADDSTFDFAIYGWVKCEVTAPTESAKAVYEYVSYILWAGNVTLCTLTGLAGGFETTTRFADTLTADVALLTAIDAFTGLTANIHSPGSNASRAFVAIEDASHIFDGFTAAIDMNAGGGSAATSGNLLVQIIQ